MAQRVLLTNKCLKSLELMAQSLLQDRDLSSYLGSAMKLNVESLLTLNVESQHVVTHFRKETSTLYEYGSSIKEGVKRVSSWCARYYTHPNSYYPVETSAAG